MGWGEVLVKMCTCRKQFQHWKLKSQSSSSDLRFFGRDFFVENGFQSLCGGSVLCVLERLTVPPCRHSTEWKSLSLLNVLDVKELLLPHSLQWVLKLTRVDIKSLELKNSDALWSGTSPTHKEKDGQREMVC